MRTRCFLVYALSLLPLVAAAQLELPSEESMESSSETTAGVLNFDADTIVGDKQAPDIMFRRASDSLDFEAVLHIRQDFNDFVIGDQKRIPDLVE